MCRSFTFSEDHYYSEVEVLLLVAKEEVYLPFSFSSNSQPQEDAVMSVEWFAEFLEISENQYFKSNAKVNEIISSFDFQSDSNISFISPAGFAHYLVSRESNDVRKSNTGIF